MNRLISIIFLVMTGCPGPAPETCGQLRWNCGTDDMGRSCGTCQSNQLCSNGSCVHWAGACDTPPFSHCTTTSICCSDQQYNRATSCTMIRNDPSLTYCEPLCRLDSECSQYSSPTARWSCVTRSDGVGVCVPE